MKKRTAGLGMILLLVAALVTSPALAQETEPITITVWGGWGHFRDATLPKVIEAFEQAHPHIRVETRQVTGDMEGLMVQLIGGVAPDIYMVRAEQMPTFVAQGLAYDLTPFFQRDIDVNDYLPAWSSMHYNGRYYGIPAEGGGYREDGIFINRDIFNKAGIPVPSPDPAEALTFDEWTELSIRLTQDVDGDGTPDQWGTHFRTTRWYFFLPSNGVNVFTDDWSDTLIDTPEAIEVLDVLQKLLIDYNVVSPDTYMFEREGNVAMNIYWQPRVSSGARENIGDKFDWSVAPMPAGKAGSVGLTKMNPFVVNPDTQYPEEAWTFLRFFLSEEGQRIVADDNRAVVLRSVALAPEYVYLDYPPYNLLPFVAGAAVDVMYQFEPPGVTRPQAVSQALSRLWKGEIPAQTAAEQMASAWRSVLSNRD